jgi:hypothetical protein
MATFPAIQEANRLAVGRAASFDEPCVQAGLDKVKDMLKQARPPTSRSS